MGIYYQGMKISLRKRKKRKICSKEKTAKKVPYRHLGIKEGLA
jgi:hypothetical protein